MAKYIDPTAKQARRRGLRALDPVVEKVVDEIVEKDKDEDPRQPGGPKVEEYTARLTSEDIQFLAQVLQGAQFQGTAEQLQGLLNLVLSIQSKLAHASIIDSEV